MKLRLQNRIFEEKLFFTKFISTIGVVQIGVQDPEMNLTLNFYRFLNIKYLPAHGLEIEYRNAF